MIIIWLFFAVLFCFLCYKKADTCGREPVLWAIMGFFFGLFAYIVLLMMGDNKVSRGA